MNYFEKIFLGTTTFVGIILFFLMGLYFDLGDMFTGAIDSRGFVTRGAAVDRLVDNLERVKRVRSAKAQGDGTFGHVSRVPLSSSMSRSDITKRYQEYFGGPLLGSERVEQYREYLLKQGFTNVDFIEMKSLAQDNTLCDTNVVKAQKLSAAGDIEEAIIVLEDALTLLPEKDYEHRLRLATMIIQFALRFGDVKKARIYTEEQIELHSKVLSLESKSKLMEKSNFNRRVTSELKSITEKRAQIETIFASLEERQKKTGKYNGLLDHEKSAFKASALELKSSGKISAEVYTEMLELLE